MNISIAPELEELVRAKIKSGMYQSANELFGAALTLLAERDDLHLRRREALDNFIQVALDQAEHGEFCDPDEIWKELDQIIFTAEAKAA